MANLDYNDFRRCACAWRMVLPANSLKLRFNGGMAPSYSGHPAGAAGGSGVDFQRPLHCRVSGFVQSCAAPNCQSSARCRNGPCTESGEGGCPPIDVGNGVTTESAPNIWRWRTAVEHYVGIDVSLELSSICVVDGRGKIVKEAKVASEPEALVCFFNELGVPVNRIGLEAGPLSQWLHAGLTQAGFQT